MDQDGNTLSFDEAFDLDIFENPLRPPLTHRVPKPPPATKRNIQNPNTHTHTFFRAASGPFLGEQLISGQSRFKMGFLSKWAEMGPKAGFGVQKWVKSGSKPIFDPL